MYKLSYYISKFLSPGVVWVLGVAILSFTENQIFIRALLLTLSISAISLSPPLFVLKIRRQKTDIIFGKNSFEFLHPIFLLAILSGIVLAFLVLKLTSEYRLLPTYLVCVAALTIVLYIIRFFSNFSGHVAAVSCLAIFLWQYFYIAPILTLPIVIVVGASRVMLKAHTIGEVLGGFFTSAIVTLLIATYYEL